ncbi:MAG: XRE family transcriptional regulator [Lachnospiraceae bacterium]|nr:XRE family transcriptional regulator [Lachnospiraceae bacterium]
MLYSNLKAEMARRGITNRDLAQAIGKREEAVSRKMTGKSDFTVFEASTIKKAFSIDVPIEQLFFKTEG